MVVAPFMVRAAPPTKVGLPPLSKNVLATVSGLPNGGTTFPQIFVGEQHIGGSDDMMALERAGKLDALLNA